MNQFSEDEKYMRRCLWLAEQGMIGARPNPMVGAVIVASGGRIIGEGYHVHCGQGHAEVNAFASVSASDAPLLRESTLYVSLEPCSHYGKTPPCAELVIRKGVRRVVAGCVDPFAKVSGRGIAMLREAGIEVTVGVLEDECRHLNRRFITFHSLGRPYITLKWAQSANGFVDDNFRPTRLSTPYTQMLVHKLRSECAAIAVGRITAERDRPRLDTRLWAGPSPRRFVLGAGFTIDSLLDACREEQLQSLLVEGGPAILRSFMERSLWDEIRVETAPVTVSGGTPAPELPREATLKRRLCADGNTIDEFVHG